MLRLGIRVSTVSNKGLGHLLRCLAVRKHIIGQVNWFIDFKDNYIEKKINSEDNIFYENGTDKYENLKKLVLNKTINCIFIDSYSLNFKAFSNVPTIFLVDDKTNIKANIIICPQPIKFAYVSGIKYLCGPKYSPISEEYFYSNKNNIRTNILVSFGSYDSKGITLNVIRAISNLITKGCYNYNIIILLGKKSPIIKEVRLLISKYSNFNLIIDSANLNDIYSKCFLAIGAVGLSFMERVASGIPNLLIAQNLYHKKLIRQWVELGCALESDKSSRGIEKKLMELIDNKDMRKTITKNGERVIDGKGSYRIAKHVNGLIKND